MAKEIIKNNEIDAPTLFVGVGGTGCKVLRELANMCRPGELENVSFVGMDTNVNDLKGVKNNDVHIYSIQTSNTQTVGNYLDYDADALNYWFPKNAVLYDKTVSEGAGQVRAISRLALNSTIKTGKIAPLYDAIDELFRKNGKELKQAMRCVIVSTASGGTGSGIILPIAMYIRDYIHNKYPNTNLIVRSLILLPETLDSVIKSSVERESQRRNAYATIKEINAFMMKGSGFFDIVDELNRYKDLHIDFPIPGTDDTKSLSLLPFDFCFLMDGQNAEDSTLVSLPQYIQQAAVSLYEQNIGPMQKNAFSMEDNIIKEMSNKDNHGRNRFGGIGAGIVRYPYEDIADYVAYDWVISSIGDDSATARWTQYDKAYELIHTEEKKKDIPETEMQSRGDVYITKLTNNSDKFSKDLRSTFLSNADMKINGYLNALKAKTCDCVWNDRAISAAWTPVQELAEERDYVKEPDLQGKAKENLSNLEEFKNVVFARAERLANGFAESLVISEKKTIEDRHENYSLEQLLKNTSGEICHPNAARYLLYRLEKEFRKLATISESEYFSIADELDNFLNTKDSAAFDVKKTKKTETDLEAFCNAEAEVLKSKLEEPQNKYYSKLNEHFVFYYNKVHDYAENVALKIVYSFAAEYIKELCHEYETFFKTFQQRRQSLLRKQDDIVTALHFNKGDSIFNVCATSDMLKELSTSTMSICEGSSMLDKELNGSIFDAIKENVAFARELRNSEDLEADRSVDVFNDILIKYFCKDVRRKCKDLDMNIIEAIAQENKLLARIKKREELANDPDGDETEKKTVEAISQDANERHILDVLGMGERLAAPGIQRLVGVESRELKLCAFNKSLLEMRQYRVKDMLPNGSAVDSVSRYEMHFYNALYNLTPDKLNKFAAPKVSETGSRSAGLYHNAYFGYARDIGPDSRKNMVISTHIDKRWDSVSVMPEIDFAYMGERILKIHKAMIYGLIYKAISRVSLSTLTKKSKQVYKYISSEERKEEMVVSNGTLCDEFYEILDALYLSSAIVEDMDEIKAQKREKDSARKSNYKNTTFAKALDEFYLETVHEGKTSLFEIPVCYYNSLPNSMRYLSEISSLVDATIDVFREELYLWESDNDAQFLLCDVLKEQFELLMSNYKKYPALMNNQSADSNPVIDIIYRKLRHIISATPEPDDYEEILEEMKSLISDDESEPVAAEA